MGAEQWVNITLGLAVIAFLWNLHRNVVNLRRDVASLHPDIASLHNQFADLRLRMARLEGLAKGWVRLGRVMDSAICKEGL